MSTKKNQNNTSLIATIVIAALACAAAIIAVIMLNLPGSGNNGGQAQNSGAQNNTAAYLTQEYRDEVGLAAHDLLDDSHEILRLFVTEGLHHNDEPYGNLPEDGYYTVNNTDYDLDKIETLVRSVYVEDEADRVLHNIDGSRRLHSRSGRYHKVRDRRGAGYKF